MSYSHRNNERISFLLCQIADLLPDTYKVTLIARKEGKGLGEEDLVITTDPCANAEMLSLAVRSANPQLVETKHANANSVPRQ